MKQKADYIDVSFYAKEHGKKAAAADLGISQSHVSYIVAIGDAFMGEKSVEKNAKTIDKFTPRELMEELARRGYTGKLSFTQTIDITSF
jgi:hypothetical protein